MGKDEKPPKEAPKVEPKSEAKSEKEVKWTMNKPNPKKAYEPPCVEPDKGFPKSITTKLSQTHKWSGGKVRVEGPRYQDKTD